MRTLSFNLELSEPNGDPLALGSGPARTIITSDKGTLSIGTVSGKTYPVTVRNVPQAAKAITLTVKKRGFVDTAIGPIVVPAAGNPGPQVKTIAYALTTTVSGKVVTPARAADAAKGSHISMAEVWASTDPDNKVPVNPADGSYTLNGVKHSGTFNVTAEYTATGNSNYKTSDPQIVSTTAPAHTQDIALKYGYTTALTVTVLLHASAFATGTASSGVNVVIEVEGIKAHEGTTGGSPTYGYTVTVDHPGRLSDVTASMPGYTGTVLGTGNGPVPRGAGARLTQNTYTHFISLHR